jgi:hypothetical protein
VPATRRSGALGTATLETAARNVQTAYAAAAGVLRDGEGHFDVPRVTIGVPPGAAPEWARLVVSVEVYLAALARDLGCLAGARPAARSPATAP